MITLNEDYSDFERQAKNLAEKLMSGVNSLEVFDYVLTFDEFLSYSENKIEDVTQNEVLDSFFWEVSSRYSANFETNFKENLLYHQPFLNTLDGTIKDLIRYVERKFRYLRYDEYLDFSGNKDLQLLNAFFREEEPILKDIFDDMQKHKRIYYEKEESDPFCIYNYYEDIPSIFLHPRRKYTRTLEDLSDLVHELGHVKTGMEINEQDPEKALRHGGESLYQEVMSYYYEYKFLEFLIGNDIQTAEAKDVIAENLYALKGSFHNCKVFRKKHINYDNLFENIQYCYGPVLAYYLVDHPNLLESFSKIQYDPFHHEQLENIGFTPQVASSIMKSKIITYFRR